MSYQRVRLGHLRLPEPGPVLAGDPWLLADRRGSLFAWPSAPAGRFPVYADVADTGAEGGERIGRALLVFDQAKLAEAWDRCWEPLGTIGVDTATVAFLAGSRAANWREEEHAPLLRAQVSARIGARGYGWAEIDLAPDATLVACTSGFGDGQYLVVRWYGPDTRAPGQDIAALGVIFLEEMTPR